jgi:hypothetical protein
LGGLPILFTIESSHIIVVKLYSCTDLCQDDCRKQGENVKEQPVRIDPREKHALPPCQFMQLMEPPGATDSSVEAAWDFKEDRWKKEIAVKLKVTK